MAGWYVGPSNVQGVLRGHPVYKAFAAGGPMCFVLYPNADEMAG